MRIELTTVGVEIPCSRFLSHNPTRNLRRTPPLRSARCSDLHSEGGPQDAELAALVAAWPMLTEPIKAAIMVIVHSANGGRQP